MKSNHYLREFALNSRHPSLYACGRGVASRGPYATLWGSGESAESGGEFREANFYAQARYLRAIGPELEDHFGTKSGNLVLSTPRHPKGPKKTPKGPQGRHLGKILVKSWQYLGKILATSWQNLGNILAKSWQNLGNILTTYWRNLGKTNFIIETLFRNARDTLL